MIGFVSGTATLAFKSLCFDQEVPALEPDTIPGTILDNGDVPATPKTKTAGDGELLSSGSNPKSFDARLSSTRRALDLESDQDENDESETQQEEEEEEETPNPKIPALDDARFPKPTQGLSLSDSAIRGRMRRLFLPNVHGNFKVSDAVLSDFKSGGERRKSLESIFASCGYCQAGA